MRFCYHEVFLFTFSIHVGVVTICSAGIMLMSTSLWVNLVTQDPEIKLWAKAAHWTIVSFFDISGLGIYTLGMIAAYKESFRLANISFSLLILHGLAWLALTILSFGNWVHVSRAVCIDHRCADRLFIKNGNWRMIFVKECMNPSMERWLESAGHSAMELESLDAPQNSTDNRKKFDETSHGLKQGSKHFGSARRKSDQPDVLIHKEITELLTALVDGNDTYRKVLEALLNNKTSLGELKRKKKRILWKSASKYNKTLIHTPIGYVGCNAVSHTAYSAICALLILGCWYIYPCIVIGSYARILYKRQITIEEL